MFNEKEVADIFINHLKEEGKSESTLLAYGKDIEQFLDFLVSVGIKELDEQEDAHIKLFLETLGKKKYTPKSVSRKLNSIRTFCKIMNEKGLMTKNPSSVVTHPKIESKEPRVLSAIEYRALRDVCRKDQRLYTIVELMLQTGIRIGELARLSLEDIHEEKNNTHLFIKAYGSYGERIVPLNQTAMDAINDYLKIRQTTETKNVFVTKTGRPLLVRNIRTTINRAFRNAGVSDAKVNDLRNTFIAHNLSKGSDLVTISKIVGHKRISTTEKYLDLLKKDEHATKLEEL